MSFFTQASFVMDPNVYGVGKLYVPKPTDGSGDLTFTRASNGTRVNQDGLIEKVRTNLLPYSQDFSNWSTNSCTVSTNTTANPLNGAVDADTITFTGATTQKYVIQAFSFNGNYTVSVYLKAGTNQFVQFLIGSDASPYVNFDLVNGISNAFGSTANIVSVGNGWYRCSMSFTSTIGTHVFLNAVNSLSAYRFDATSSTGTLIAFGYQLETGDIATDYIPTTSSAVTVGPIANIPRLNYGADGCPSLLLEPQRTNLALYSEQFNNAAWNQTTATITANTTISPDGYQNADTVTNIGTGTQVGQSQGGGIIGQSYTFSIWVKRLNGTGEIQIRDINNSSTVIVPTSEWQRFSITATANSTTLRAYFNVVTSGDSVAVWGAQLEAGSYATSYIPTLSSAVTRVADAAYKTGMTSAIGQTEGTLFADFIMPPAGNLFTHYRISGAGGLYNDSQNISITATNQIRGWSFTGSATQAQINSGIYAEGTRVKVAYAYKANDFVLYVNGVQIGTDTSGSVPAMSELLIGSYYPDTSLNVLNRTNQFLLFKTRLSNADLARLTSL